MPTRQELHEIVDTLPEEMLERGLAALRYLKDGPPKAMVQGRDATFARMQERFKAMQERFKDRPFAAVGGGGGHLRPDGKGSSNYSFGYVDEDGTPVRETSTIRDGHEVTITERLRIDEPMRTLRVILDVRGPDGTTGQFDHTFKLSPLPGPE